MDKNYIREVVKNNPVAFHLYRAVGSAVLRLAGAVFATNEKKLFFISFGGRRYDDSPKSIYEEMLGREEFSDCEFVWAFVGNHEGVPGNPKTVKTATPRFFFEILTSRFWITNSSVERGLSFKRKRNFCVNTWHGTPIKRIVRESHCLVDMPALTLAKERFDAMCAQGPFDIEVFSRAFNVAKDNVKAIGLPRNDRLVHYTKKEVEVIRRELGIPADKKVLLYTPTYREYVHDNHEAPTLKPPIDLRKWEEALGSRYVLLIRAHYLMTHGIELDISSFATDVSGYEPLNDLYAVADAMISDYSSTLVDYAILGKPLFCYAYDIEEYAERRGFYEDIFRDLPCDIDRTEDALIEHIVDMDYEKLSEQSRAFAAKYAPEVGNASKAVADLIAGVMRRDARKAR